MQCLQSGELGMVGSGQQLQDLRQELGAKIASWWS